MNFFSRVKFLCRLLTGVHSIPVLLQWHVKDPSHSAESTGARLQLNTHTPFTQRSQSKLTKLSRHSMGTHQGNELTHIIGECLAMVISAH